MAASAGPVEGTGRGRHAAPGTFRPGALLGPIARPEWREPEDPYELGRRQPANVGRVLPRQAGAQPEPALATTDAPATVAVRALRRLVDLLALAVALLALVRTARSAPLSTAEAARAVRVVAAARPDIGPLPGGLPQRIFDAIAAGWVSLTGALHRQPTAALVVREPAVLAAALALVLLWVLAGRLRLALPTRVAVILVAALAPAGASLLAGAARPGVLAALLVVLAAVLIAGFGVGLARKVLALLLLTLALLLVPALAVALAATLAVLIGQGDLAARLHRPARRPATGALLLAALVALAAYPLGLVPHALRTGAAITPPRPGPVEWAGAVLLLLAAGLASRQRWLRAPAAAVFALVLTAVAAPVARADLLAVALPMALLVGFAYAEELLTGYLRRRRGRRARTFGPSRRVATRSAGRGAYATALLVAVAVLACGGYQLSRPAPRPAVPPSAAVASWFRTEVSGAPAVGTEDALWPGLLAAGMPAEQLTTPTAGPAPAAPWLVTTAVPATGWVAYARFGPLHILRRAGSPGADQPADAADNAALAGNPALHLTPAARAALTTGRLDERLLAVLAQYAGGHTLDIAGFPSAAGGDPAGPGAPPLRRVLITAADGNPVTQATVAQLVSTWFDRQIDQYHPCEVRTDGPAVLVRYCLSP